MDSRKQQLDAGKVLWFLGDDAILPAINQVAASLDYTLLEKAVPGCDAFQVRTEQILDVWMRRRSTPVDVVIYLASDFDSEGLIWKLLKVVKNGSRIILVVKDTDLNAIEGFGHFEGDNFKLVVLGSQPLAECLTTLLSNEN